MSWFGSWQEGQKNMTTMKWDLFQNKNKTIPTFQSNIFCCLALCMESLSLQYLTISLVLFLLCNKPSDFNDSGHCFITTLYHGPDYPGPLTHLCSKHVSWSWWLHTGSGKNCLKLYSCLLVDVGGQCIPHSAGDLCHNTTVKISVNCQPDRL